VSRVVIAGQERFLGACKRDDFDPRDLVMKVPAPSLNEFSLRPDWKLKIRNQGQRGTCTANGTLEAAGYLYVREDKPDPEGARLFLYWITRVLIEGTAATDDSGCQIRDVLRALRQYGCCPESLLPYSDDDVAFTLKPSDACFVAAELHKALFFYRCPDLASIKASIAQKFPVIMGFSVPDNFMSDECAATGRMKMPTKTEGFNGGHCMVYAQFSDVLGELSGPNSWGEDWGDKGWFHQPYGFVEQGLVHDCWSLRKVQE